MGMAWISGICYIVLSVTKNNKKNKKDKIIEYWYIQSFSKSRFVFLCKEFKKALASFTFRKSALQTQQPQDVDTMLV